MFQGLAQALDRALIPEVTPFDEELKCVRVAGVVLLYLSLLVST
jgi:hypothetical protein